jgi:hypothetical protein
MTRYRVTQKPDIVTWDMISGHFVAVIGENADIGGGNNPDGVNLKLLEDHDDSLLTSGNPRKFRHGIYLVYTWYILSAFVIGQ